jgi:hypothetical protein
VSASRRHCVALRVGCIVHRPSSIVRPVSSSRSRRPGLVGRASLNLRPVESASSGPLRSGPHGRGCMVVPPGLPTSSTQHHQRRRASSDLDRRPCVVGAVRLTLSFRPTSSGQRRRPSRRACIVGSTSSTFAVGPASSVPRRRPSPSGLHRRSRVVDLRRRACVVGADAGGPVHPALSASTCIAGPGYRSWVVGPGWSVVGGRSWMVGPGWILRRRGGVTSHGRPCLVDLVSSTYIVHVHRPRTSSWSTH